MNRPAALVAFLLLPTLAAAAPADCAATPTGPGCDAAQPALEREAARLARLAAAGATGAQKRELAQSDRSFRASLAACAGAGPCLRRNLIDRIFELRQAHPRAQAQDSQGISLGPFPADCPGLGAPVSVAFVNSAPAFAILVWRDRTLVLTQAPSASGARFTAPFGVSEAQFWNKGDQATLDLPGKASLTCRIEQGR